MRIIVVAALFVLLAYSTGQAAVWQYSVPAPTIEGRRAFLWVPPDCPRVRGLIVAVHNMLEKPLFERPAFRTAAEENGLGIVMIFSGHDRAPDDDRNPGHPRRSALDIFLNPDFPKGSEDPRGAGEDLQKVLDALAEESGYTEIRNVPLMPVGHSSAGSFVWHLYQWNPSRFFAIMPFKTGAKYDGPQGIPIFDVNSEWFEYGSGTMHNCSLTPGDLAQALHIRANGNDSLAGYFVDIGSGHCDVSDDAIPIMALFLKKVVAARIPADAPLDGHVPLKPVKTGAGWLLDPATFGKPGGKPVATSDWKGDPRNAFWYLDKDLASAVQNHIAAQLAKKPQYIGFVKEGHRSTDARMFSFSPKFLDDAGTFRLEAGYVDHIDHAEYDNRIHNVYYPGDAKLGHSSSTVRFRVNSGALTQVGPDTFRVCPHAGPLEPQGNPWEPTIVAYNPGDDTFRPTEIPAHVHVNIINREGQAQTLDFLKISDQIASGLRPLKLQAKASSGLPVQYFVVSGPAEITGDTLTFSKIPARSKYPVRVIVAAFQWGRQDNPKVQSAGPVMQEFFIRR